MKIAMTTRLSKQTIEQIKALAEKSGASQAEVIAIAIDRYYNQKIGEDRMKFVKILGNLHLNSESVYLYDNGTVQAENANSGRVMGKRKFESAEQAEEWFDGLGSKNIDCVAEALDQLKKI